MLKGAAKPQSERHRYPHQDATRFAGKPRFNDDLVCRFNGVRGDLLQMEEKVMTTEEGNDLNKTGDFSNMFHHSPHPTVCQERNGSPRH